MSNRSIILAATLLALAACGDRSASSGQKAAQDRASHAAASAAMDLSGIVSIMPSVTDFSRAATAARIHFLRAIESTAKADSMVRAAAPCFFGIASAITSAMLARRACPRRVVAWMETRRFMRSDFPPEASMCISCCPRRRFHESHGPLSRK